MRFHGTPYVSIQPLQFYVSNLENLVSNLLDPFNSVKSNLAKVKVQSVYTLFVPNSENFNLKFNLKNEIQLLKLLYYPMMNVNVSMMNVNVLNNVPEDLEELNHRIEK